MHKFRFFAVVALLTSMNSVAAQSLVNFESGQVRPLSLSPDGQHLYAVNTPDNRLEIFAVLSDGLQHLGAVSVGLEPIAVASRNNDEVWVVNHLSDSVPPPTPHNKTMGCVLRIICCTQESLYPLIDFISEKGRPTETCNFCRAL